MFVRRSTHKRKRSSARADHARDQKSLGGGRSVLDVGFFRYANLKGKEKAKESDGQSSIGSTEADHRCLRVVERYAFTHALNVVIPLPNLDLENHEESQHALLLAACNQDHRLRDLVNSLGLFTSAESVPSSSGAKATPRIYHAKVPLALFLNPEFVTGFIRNGTLIALSTETSEAEDTVALDAQGILTLSLTRETYQTLGLVGRESRFHRGPSGRAGDRDSGMVNRYIVQLPITASSFVPGKPGYERALSCLRAWDWSRASQADLDQPGSGFTKLAPTSIGEPVEPGGATGSKSANATWNMLFAWTAPSFGSQAPVQTGTIAFPKSLVEAGDIRQVPTPGTAVTTPDTWIPILNSHPRLSVPSDPQDVQPAHRTEPTLVELSQRCSEPGGMDEMQEAVQSLTEWFALVTLGSESVRTFARPDPLISSFDVPTPRRPGGTLRLSWTGFFPPAYVVGLLEQVLHFLDASADQSDQDRWAAISVEGFEHSPISWCSTHPGQSTALGSGSVLPTAKSKISSNSESSQEQSKAEPAPSAEVPLSIVTDQTGSPNVDDATCSDSSNSAAGGGPTSNGHQVSKKNAKQRNRLKRRREGHVRQGETEHGGGRTGWTAFFFGRDSTQPNTAADSGPLPRYIMVEDLGQDLRQ